MAVEVPHGALKETGLVLFLLPVRFSNRTTLLMKNQPLTDAQQKALIHIASVFELKTSAGTACLEQAVRNIVLLDKKQLDYGPRNISSFGVFGILVRMNDKLERLKTLMSKGRRRRAQNESIRDSFVDLSNYGIIATVVEDDRWPNT